MERYIRIRADIVSNNSPRPMKFDQPVTFEIDQAKPIGIMELVKMVYEAEKDGASRG